LDLNILHSNLGRKREGKREKWGNLGEGGFEEILSI